MIRLSIAAASIAVLAATSLASAQEYGNSYNGGVFGMQSVYGNSYNSYNTYRQPSYNSYNTYNSYDSGRRYGNTWSSYARQGYSYRCTYRCY
jgi:hypothetical protein